MSNKTSNVSPSTISSVRGDYGQHMTYEESTAVNSFSAIEEIIETRTAYCKSSTPCEINIRLNFDEIEKREAIYRINKKLR